MGYTWLSWCAAFAQMMESNFYALDFQMAAAANSAEREPDPVNKYGLS